MRLYPNNLRKTVLKMVYDKNSGHIGGSFSIAELIALLYNEYDLINVDKLILSKGHAAPILYAALYELGLIESLDNFREINSPLQGHPDKQRLKYLHATTGSLGQGLSISIGHALGSRLKGINSNIFCVLGDGELQEGQVWEAFMLAPKYNLNNLICFVDNNKAQNDGYITDVLDIGNIEDKIKSFGWHTSTIDGHNMAAIHNAINNKHSTLPTCIILNTVKGKGVSFMEKPEWHAKVPNKEEYNNALKELSLESNS